MRAHSRKVRYLFDVLVAVVAILMLGICVIVPNSEAKPNEADLEWMSANRIIFPEPCKSGGSGGCSTIATGDYSAVLNAKNADKSFFNGAGDVPSLQWSTSEADMKRVLETYGDLAYQLGKAAGVPWIAVLAQAHFEDPQSVCGHNNFWGNWCDPSHAYTGGADAHLLAATGRTVNNLGEGFVEYGKTVHNGYYEEALTKTDPLEYIKALEGTWIGTGSSYMIEGHIKALQAYIETPEGKAIVETFGSYSSATENCTSNGLSNAVGEKGLSDEQAAYLLAFYAQNRNGDSEKYASMWWDGTNHSNFQCTAFSAWFVNKFTKQTLNGRFYGSQAVSEAISQSGGQSSSSPEVFSLFSESGIPGHTGIVVGMTDDGTPIMANYNGAYHGGYCNCLPESAETLATFKPEDAYYFNNPGNWADSLHPYGVSHGYSGGVSYLKLDVDTKALSEYLGQMANGSTSGGGGGSCEFATYDYSDDDLKKLAAIAASENDGTIQTLKNEMSLMANLFESSRGNGYSSVLDYVLNGGWFGDEKDEISGDSASSEQLEAARDVFNEGRRTLPKEIDEHDCIDCGKYGYDITSIEIDGKVITDQSELLNPDNYVKNKTILHNKYTATYTFYGWMDPNSPVSSDPMGYTGSSVSCDPSEAGFGGGGGGSCSSSSSSSSSTGGGDVVRAVEEILTLANENGSTYTPGGGHNGTGEADGYLSGGAVNIDCTGLSTLALYKAYGIYAPHSTSSILSGQNSDMYEEVSRSDVRPGDVFAFYSGDSWSGGHGGVVIEVNNGRVTKVAEAGTGDRIGATSKNTNIGYTTSGGGWTLSRVNSDAGRFFRLKGVK